MHRTILSLAMLLGAGVASGQKYSGPKCLGPYCIDQDLRVGQLLQRLGPAPRRSSPFLPYCYQVKDGKVSLYVRSTLEVPAMVDAVFLGDFPNCMHMSTAVTLDDLNAWKTPEEIGLGSTEEDLLRTYGKPSRVDKVDSKLHKWLIRGYRQGDNLPDVGNKQLVYDADPAISDLSFATFGIRNGKVSFVWLSNSE